MSNKHIFFPITILCLFAILLSCNNKHYLSDQTQTIAQGEWFYKDQLKYNFDIQDTTKVYNIYLEISHAKDYTYQNLYLKIHTLFPNGKKIEQQVSFELADKYGQWYGDCNSRSCNLLVDLQKRAYFNTIGEHTITLEQYMRKDPIAGIYQLGVKIEDTGKSRE